MRQRYVDWLRLTLGDTRYGRRSGRIPPGSLLPLDECDGGLWDGGFAEVDQRLSGEAVEPRMVPSPRLSGG